MLERLIGNPVDLLVASPLHLLALLIVLCVFAFRAPTGSRLRRWRYPILATLTWAWITATPVVAHALALTLENAYPAWRTSGEASEAEGVIIVLAAGGGYNPGIPDHRQLDLASHRRTLAGVDLWREIGGIVVTVGSSRFPEPKEIAERMADFAVEMGVDKDAVQAQPGSLNTFENLDQLDRGLLRGRRGYLVTSAMHMPRAMDVARAQGLDLVPVPADHRARAELSARAWLPDNNAMYLFHLAMHEWVGRLYYRLKGWA